MTHDCHNHSHDHSSHSHHSDQSLSKAFKYSLLINFCFVIIEFYYSQKTLSLSLFSDALHNLSDVFVLFSSLIAQKLLHNPRFKKTSALITVMNGLVLILTIFYILKESYLRYFTPQTIFDFQTIMVVALIGIFINLGSALLFRTHQHDHLNASAAYLHLMTDAAVSLSVIISTFIISKTGFMIIDPILSIIISLLLLYNTIPLLKKSIRNYKKCN